ncbi:hypothetical protein [Hydrogenophaga sp. 2FB]|uniref:hypothetical protein n=1 Tax=Hydrogenophaga sp. 2FB TaxID=2502187 RepID=UPI0010FA5485|nr:hypothetical protein [Hydrogenophaga sp. 2FB]
MNTATKDILQSLQPSPAARSSIELLVQASLGSAGTIAQRVRDTLTLDEMVIVECVNEAVVGLDAHHAEVFRRALHSTPGFPEAIKRATVDIGVVLSLAKTFEDDDAFIDAAGLLHDIDFKAHNTKVADFALLLIETDMRNAQDAKEGRSGANALLYDLVPYDVTKRRLQTLHAFVRIAAGRLELAALN